MAQRVKADDLQKIIDAGHVLVLKPGDRATLILNGGIWHRIATTYKNEHSANASASIFRKKLGAGFRVKSIGCQVYVIFDGAPTVQGATVLEVAA